MLQSVSIHCLWRTQIAQNLHPNSTFWKSHNNFMLNGNIFYSYLCFYIWDNDRWPVYDNLFSLIDNMGPEPQFLPGDMIHPSSSPDPIQMHAHDGPYRHPGPPNSMAGNFSSLSHSEMAGEAWWPLTRA